MIQANSAIEFNVHEIWFILVDVMAIEVIIRQTGSGKTECF